jgi:hypothetical protein
MMMVGIALAEKDEFIPRYHHVDPVKRDDSLGEYGIGAFGGIVSSTNVNAWKRH